MQDKTTNKTNLFLVGFAIVAILFYSQRADSRKLVSMENAKRIAKEGLENRKEEYEIPTGANITTGFCRLEPRMGAPYEWHIAVKVETQEREKMHWRIDIHPYTGIITGIVNEKYDGTTFPEKIYIQPDLFTKE